MRRFGLQPELQGVGDWFTLGASPDKDPSDWVYLGRLSEWGRQANVRLAVGEEKVIAIFGKRGQGKSFTLGCLLEGLALATPDPAIAAIERPRAAILFDPLNIFQWIDIALTEEAAGVSDELESQVARAREWGLTGTPLEAQIFYPAGYTSNVYRSSAREFRLGVSAFGIDEWASLLDFDMVKDIRGQLATEVWEKVTNIGWTSTTGEIIPAATDPIVGDYQRCLAEDVDIQSGIYTPDTIRALAQRLRSIASHAVFQGHGTPLLELLKPGQVSVLLLNGLPTDLRNVVASVLTRRILAARAEASGAQKDLMLNPNLSPAEKASREQVVASAPPKTWVVIDEAQEVIPNERRTAASAAIVKLVKEGRNFGLSLVLTTQQPIAVDQRVLSQVETFIVHKLVSRSDVDRTIENLKCPVPSAISEGDRSLSLPELLTSLEVGQVMVSDTYAARCVVVQVRARVAAHGGFEA
jgi:DNA helicase HerA-like ATPase